MYSDFEDLVLSKLSTNNLKTIEFTTSWSDNNLKSYAKFVNKCTKLQQLTLSVSNDFTEIAAAIENCSTLRFLKIIYFNSYMCDFDSLFQVVGKSSIYEFVLEIRDDKSHYILKSDMRKILQNQNLKKFDISGYQFDSFDTRHKFAIALRNHKISQLFHSGEAYSKFSFINKFSYRTT